MTIYVVYILTNKKNSSLYIGVTNNLRRRIIEHKLGIIEGFSKTYNLKKLIYFEQFECIEDAINREKKLKNWHRDWKINLIKEKNPYWSDLYIKVYGPIDKEYQNYILNYHLEKKSKIKDSLLF